MLLVTLREVLGKVVSGWLLGLLFGMTHMIPPWGKELVEMVLDLLIRITFTWFLSGTNVCFFQLPVNKWKTNTMVGFFLVKFENCPHLDFFFFR